MELRCLYSRIATVTLIRNNTHMVYLNKEQMEKVYEEAFDVLGISSLNIMDKAGENIADFIESMKPKKVIVCYGAGNAGGVGLAIARIIHQRGIFVEIVMAEKKLRENTIEQLSRARKTEISEVGNVHAESGDVVVDALVGYNLSESPKGEYAVLIDKMNSARSLGAKIVSVDVPTGIDSTTGFLYTPHVKADYTLSLGLPKSGMKEARDEIGELHLVDIGVPEKIYESLHIPNEHYFGRGSVVKIW